MGLSFNSFKRKERREERRKEEMRKRNHVNAWISKQFKKGNVYSVSVHTSVLKKF